MPDIAWRPKTEKIREDIEKEKYKWEVLKPYDPTAQRLPWQPKGFEDVGQMQTPGERFIGEWAMPIAALSWLPAPSLLRAGLAPIAARGGIKGALPSVARAGLKPLEMIEQVPSAIGRGVQRIFQPPKAIKPPVPAAEAIPKAPIEVPAVTKLLNILKAEKPVLRKTEALRRAELHKRALKMETALKGVEPEAALAKAARARAGKMPTEMPPIREQFTKEEARDLFGAIRDASLDPWEKTRAYDAFKKLFMSNEPLQKNEIRLLGGIFGPEFTKLYTTLGRKFVNFLLNAANFPRAILASTDLSATLRQGGILLARRPYLLPGMMKAQIKSLWSKKGIQAVDDVLRADPDFGLFERMGGYIAPIPGRPKALWRAEETFMTEWSRRLPVVSHSERAFIGGLNYLRFNSFKHAKQLFGKMGATTDRDYQGLAKLINYASGRGDVRFMRGDIGPVLNAIMFSPRLQLSRLQLPGLLFSPSAAVRKEAWRALAQFLAFGTGILSMFKLRGAEIEVDPRSSDFGKVKVGNTRLDFWTGYLQYSRMLAQFAIAERKVIGGTGKIQELNRLEVLQRFVQSKLSPAAGLIYDLLSGTTYIGEEITLDPESIWKQVYGRLTPLSIQDMYDSFVTDGWMGTAVASPAFLGVGVVSYEPRRARGKRNPFR